MRKRDPIKHIRDLAKSKYPAKVTCAICYSVENLQLHHYNTLTLLLRKYSETNSVDISTDEAVLDMRGSFIAAHHKELFEDVVCLCKTCHNDKLHKIYGKVPSLGTAKKQPNWVKKMRDKHNAMAKN